MSPQVTSKPSPTRRASAAGRPFAGRRPQGFADRRGATLLRWWPDPVARLYYASRRGRRRAGCGRRTATPGWPANTPADPR